jgi:hypothetical protein
MAFEIKNARNAEGELMQCNFDKAKGHFRCLDMVHALFGDCDDWEDWKDDEKEYREEQMSKQKGKTTSGTSSHQSPLDKRGRG